MNYITFNPAQTKKLAQKIAQEILKRPLNKKAIVIALIGDLGGGKTTFLQGFAKGLRIKNKILSPTFVILKRFKITQIKEQRAKIKNITAKAAANQNSKRLNPQKFYHIDCYRIKKVEEILALGFKKIISNPENIVAVEWGDRIKKILPKKSLIIRFKFINQNTRKIFISGFSNFLK